MPGSRLGRSCGDRGVQRRPLIADPIADTHDGRNDGNQQDADQHSVFNQCRATLVGDKMLDEIRNSSHDPLRVEQISSSTLEKLAKPTVN